MTYDYTAALKVERSWIGALDGDAKKHNETVMHALRIAIAVTGEPSENVVFAGTGFHIDAPKDGRMYKAGMQLSRECYKAMRDQMLKEIEDAE